MRWDALGSLAQETSAPFFEAHPSWTRVLMLKRADLSLLAGWTSIVSAAEERGILRVAKTNEAFAWAVLPRGKPAVFVLVAESAAEMIWLLRRVGDLRGMRAGV